MSGLIHTTIERLEPRALLTAVYPTAWEQYAVELINQARANPTAEAARYNGFRDRSNNVFDGTLNEGLPANTISAAPKQPLAINPYLTDAARTHSQWMVANDTFSHTGASGSSGGARITSAGFGSNNGWGENLAINWSSTAFNDTDTVFNHQRNLFTDQPIPDRGHRTNMMEASRNQIGVGIAEGQWNYPGYGNLNAFASTHNTATNGSIYLTGVAYADTTRDDNFYTPGEGLPGVTIIATRTTDQQVFSTTSWSSGGYSLQVPAGTYNVRATGGGVGPALFANDLIVTSQNVKQDFVAGETIDAPQAPDFARLDGRKLVITGSVVADVVAVVINRSGTRYVAVMNGAEQLFSIRSVDGIEITTGDGNDVVTIGENILIGTYIDTGAGRDRVTGGAGPDRINGGAQPDRIDGAGGRDTLVGAGGNDFIVGGSGSDRMYGNAGNDTIDAGSGNDRVWGGDGDDQLTGGSGRDVLYGELGADTLNGGRHTDYADTDASDTRIAVEVLV